MNIKKVDKASLMNLKQFDQMKLLDCIEEIDYMQTLLANGPDGEAPVLKTQLLDLFQDVKKLKNSENDCESEVWDRAIEADEALWALGTSCHKIIVSLYELIDCNPNIECHYMGDFNEDDDSDE